MWTSNILKTEYVNGGINVTVSYTDGTHSFTETLTLTGSEDFGLMVQRRLNNLNVIGNRVSAFPIGAYTPVSAIPAVAIPSLSASNFSSAISWLSQYTKAKNLGLVTSADTGYQSALSAAQGLFNVSAVSLL